MSNESFEAKAYTLTVHPEDVVIVHLEYEMDQETEPACIQAFIDVLRSRGYTNPVIILQPGQMIQSLPRARVMELLHDQV